MSLRLQIIVIVTILTLLGFIINMIRKEKIELKHSLVWLAVCIAILIFSIFPSLIFSLSDLMGVVTPANTIFFIASLFQLTLIFSLIVAVSRLSVRVKQLTPEVALRDYEQRMSRSSEVKDK